MAGVRIGSVAAAVLAGLALGACTGNGHNPHAEGSGSAIFDQATIRDWDGHVLRSGTNGWTCMPESTDADRHDPWCLYGSWDDFLDVYTKWNDPGRTTIGVAYMRAGDPHTRINPAGTKFKVPANWRPGAADYLMALDPDGRSVEHYSTDPHGGGTWLMWPGTPFEHVMIPADGAL